ncbi:MAG: hypothetical protein V2A53_07610, partial [bacterium]
MKKIILVIVLMLGGSVCYSQHLGHIKTFGFSPEGIDKSWEAEHYDLVVDSASLPAYKHLNPDMLGVTGKIILY